jgi:hypothetical protein
LRGWTGRRCAARPFVSAPGSSCLARIMHEPPAATADMAVLPGVLGSRTLRRTDKYASRPSPCGYPVARRSPRSRHGVSCIMRASICRRPLSHGDHRDSHDNRDQATTFASTILIGSVGQELCLTGQIRNPNTEIRNKSEIQMFQGPKQREVGLISLEEFLGLGHVGFCHLALFRISSFDMRI